jgi:UDP-glucose:(heptosyl)LPS alpha-1,3-glucosyltransferase
MLRSEGCAKPSINSDENMKVCLAIEKFDPGTGGAERYCWDLAHFLADRGHEVAVICMKASGNDNPGMSIHKIRVIKFPQALRHLSFAVMHFLKARKMKGWVHYGVGNTFYMDIYQPHGGLHDAWFERDSLRYPENMRPLIRIIKRLSLKDAVQRAFEWWTLKEERPAVLAISKMVENDIRAFCGSNPPEIHLIPNGIDIRKYSPEKIERRSEIRKSYGLGENDFVLLFVANNFILKGFRILLEALEKINQTNIRLLVVGEPDAGSMELAGKFGSMIVFAGKRAGLDYIYPACDCLAHPTYYDACSLVVLESLASGTPVITTSANGAAMFIESGKNGYVIPPADVKALEEAIGNMISGEMPRVKNTSFDDSCTVFEKIEKVVAEKGKQK